MFLTNSVPQVILLFLSCVLCIYDFPLQHWEICIPPSNNCLHTYLFNPKIYVKYCQPVPLWGGGKCVYTVMFVVRLIISTTKYHSPAWLKSVPFPATPPVWLCHVFVTQIHLSQAAFHPGTPLPQTFTGLLIFLLPSFKSPFFNIGTLRRHNSVYNIPSYGSPKFTPLCMQNTFTPSQEP